MPKILSNECLPPATSDRTSANSQGDSEFKHAVSNRSTEAVIAALWTETCLILPTFWARL